MNRIALNLFFLVSLISIPAIAQQDTLIYNPGTGNYTIQYLRENPETGELDSLVQVTFVPATKITPSINASVVFNADSNRYEYSYEIENGVGSEQNLISFLIEFGEGVNVIDISTQKWYGGRHYSDGLPINRYDWVGNQGLQPTWNKSGFILGSATIPGFGKAYFQGKAPLPVYVHGIPPQELNQQVAALQVFPANHVARTTIVPVSPPAPFDSVAFADTLLSYTAQSRTLEWITNQTVADKYIGYFDSVKYYLQEDEIASAVAVLEQVLTDAETDNGNTLTSEAYALIRFNTEYLIERLPED